MKKIKLLGLIFAVLFSLTACDFIVKENDFTSQAQSDSMENTAESGAEGNIQSDIAEYDAIDEKIKNMSLDEKIGQLLVVGIEGTEVDEAFTAFAGEIKPGAVILFADNIISAEQLTNLTNSIKSTSAYIPCIIGMDEEGGRVTRLPEDVLSMPAALTVASYDDENYCYSAGLQLGKQITGFGLHTGFSPVLDIWTNSENTVIGDRAYGQTAEQVCKLGIADMNGVRDAGAIPVVKHFPGHGDTLTDSHYGLPSVTKTKEDLWTTELLPFQSAVENNVPAMMVAHILCTELDSQYPSSLSYNIVTKLLREEMNFDGVVFTDDLTMGAITDEYTPGEAGVLALNAGCDFLSVCHGYDNAREVFNSVKNAVEEGRVSEERIDESVKRILKLKDDYNVTADTVEVPDITAMNEETQKFRNVIY